jgi:hypothetical protein
MDSISSIHDNGSTSIMISSQSFLPAVADALSSATMAITSFAGAIASLAIQISIKFQDIGETLLAAVVVLSFLQAAVATYQVRMIFMYRIFDLEPLFYSSNFAV